MALYNGEVVTFYGSTGEPTTIRPDEYITNTIAYMNQNGDLVLEHVDGNNEVDHNIFERSEVEALVAICLQYLKDTK